LHFDPAGYAESVPCLLISISDDKIALDDQPIGAEKDSSMIQKTLSRSKAFIIFFIYTVIVAALTSCTTHKNPPEASQLEGYLIFQDQGG
jgi:hypothetical protein